VAKQWNSQGITTTTGKPIIPVKAREILVSPRIAGLRRSGGKLVQATWPAIISQEEHEELTAILGVQRRQRPGGQPSPRAYLLGGLVFCGNCGHRLTGKPSFGKRRYHCDSRSGGCGGVLRVAEGLETFVVRELLSELPERLLEAARRAPEQWESLGRLLSARDADQDRLEGLEDLLADGLLDRSAYVRQQRRIKAKLAELEVQITHVRASAPRRRLRGGVTIGQIQAEWDALDLEDQRALLADHITKITVLPVGRGRHKITAASVEISWKQS
jgi:hypothetical protein